MTKTEILELYGKSVYQIRLDCALRLFGQVDVPDCLKLADDFVAALQAEHLKELKNKFK